MSEPHGVQLRVRITLGNEKRETEREKRAKGTKKKVG